MKVLDRLLGCLMLLGAIGHAFGSFSAYGKEPMTLLWSLSASFAGFLLAALNLLRTSRADDRPLAWVSFAGCLTWTAFVLRFGMLVGTFLDFRVVLNLIVTLGLASFSLRTALHSAESRTPRRANNSVNFSDA
jgi:hypothetical protein